MRGIFFFTQNFLKVKQSSHTGCFRKFSSLSLLQACSSFSLHLFSLSLSVSLSALKKKKKKKREEDKEDKKKIKMETRTSKNERRRRKSLTTILLKNDEEDEEEERRIASLIAETPYLTSVLNAPSGEATTTVLSSSSDDYDYYDFGLTSAVYSLFGYASEWE